MNLFAHHDVDATEADQLRAEIRRVELHLQHIAAEDDCAYGKARIRAYEALLQKHQRRLEALTSQLASSAA